jgi:hypothetical protein
MDELRKIARPNQPEESKSKKNIYNEEEIET